MVVRGCGPADEPLLEVRLAAEPLDCRSFRVEGATATLAPASLEPQRIAPPSGDLAYHRPAQRDAITGYVDIVEIDEERAELEWSLELPDGDRDEGELSATVCPPPSCP